MSLNHSFWSGKGFLELLNSLVVYDETWARPKTEQELDGQTTLLIDARPLVFVNPIDVVIEGQCSMDVNRNPSAPIFVPSDRYAPENAGIILVFQKCCGRYLDDYQAALSRARPDVTWVVPQIGKDLQDWRHFSEPLANLANGLIEAGIISPAQ